MLYAFMYTCACTQAWAAVSHSLGSGSGLQTFIDTILVEYARVCNDVLQKHTNKSAVALKVDIDERQYKVDVASPQLFIKCWNEATTDPAAQITEEAGRITDTMCKWKYFWCLGPLLQACRHVFAESVRHEFDVKVTSKPYVPDAVCVCPML